MRNHNFRTKNANLNKRVFILFFIFFQLMNVIGISYTLW